MTKALRCITVKRRTRGGYVIYTSNRVPGLYLAGKKEADLRSDLVPVVKFLLERNCGVRWRGRFRIVAGGST